MVRLLCRIARQLHMVAYLLELGYKLMLSAGMNVLTMPGFKGHQRPENVNVRLICHILQQFCLNFVTRVCQFVIFFLSKTQFQKSNTLLQTCSM
jgi:hypothetical protein